MSSQALVANIYQVALTPRGESALLFAAIRSNTTHAKMVPMSLSMAALTTLIDLRLSPSDTQAHLAGEVGRTEGCLLQLASHSSVYSDRSAMQSPQDLWRALL